MFISEREARERLEDKSNIFRDPSIPIPLEGYDSVLIETTVDSVGGKKQSSRDVVSSRDGEKDSIPDDKGPAISLSHLDSLINPKLNGRAHYMGQLENQVAIGETALILGPTRTSHLMGLGTEQTRAYREGLTTQTEGIAGTVNTIKPELRKRLTIVKERLAEQAAHRLGLTLDALSPDKISSIKRATNISKVAKDMASILEKCTEKEKVDTGGVHFHVYRPEMHNEMNYTTVNVGPAIPSEPI
jgi:hypothetical protein